MNKINDHNNYKRNKISFTKCSRLYWYAQKFMYSKMLLYCKHTLNLLVFSIKHFILFVFFHQFFFNIFHGPVMVNDLQCFPLGLKVDRILFMWIVTETTSKLISVKEHRNAALTSKSFSVTNICGYGWWTTMVHNESMNTQAFYGLRYFGITQQLSLSSQVYFS